MHAEERVAIQRAIGEIRTRQNLSIDSLKDDRYYAFAEALDILKKYLPEAFQEHRHSIGEDAREVMGWKR